MTNITTDKYIKLSEEQKRFLKEREKESDQATDRGLSWEEVRASIKRKKA